MSQTGNIIIREAREAQDRMPRWKLGQMVGVSESTIERWESGDTEPSPDDVDTIGKVLNDPLLWHRWMHATYPSYRKRYPHAPTLELPVAVMRLGKGLDDVLALQDAIERDVMDGVLDDRRQGSKYAERLRQLIAWAQDALPRIEKTE